MKKIILISAFFLLLASFSFVSAAGSAGDYLDYNSFTSSLSGCDAHTRWGALSNECNNKFAGCWRYCDEQAFKTFCEEGEIFCRWQEEGCIKNAKTQAEIDACIKQMDDCMDDVIAASLSRFIHCLKNDAESPVGPLPEYPDGCFKLECGCGGEYVSLSGDFGNLGFYDDPCNRNFCVNTASDINNPNFECRNEALEFEGSYNFALTPSFDQFYQMVIAPTSRTSFSYLFEHCCNAYDPNVIDLRGMSCYGHCSNGQISVNDYEADALGISMVSTTCPGVIGGWCKPADISLIWSSLLSECSGICDNTPLKTGINPPAEPICGGWNYLGFPIQSFDNSIKGLWYVDHTTIGTDIETCDRELSCVEQKCPEGVHRTFFGTSIDLIPSRGTPSSYDCKSSCTGVWKNAPGHSVLFNNNNVNIWDESCTGQCCYTTHICGDGTVSRDIGEQCEDMQGDISWDCVSYANDLGIPLDERPGVMKCKNCKCYDGTSDLDLGGGGDGDWCGDGLINQIWEQCERDTDCLLGQECDGLCRCVQKECGDGNIQQGEECEQDSDCDIFESGNDLTCSDCKCVDLANPSVCGNGELETGEQCEMIEDCDSVIYGENPSCINCECSMLQQPRCGDSVIDPEEECELASDCEEGESCISCLCQEETATDTCPDDQRIMKISDNLNALGSSWEYGEYEKELCYDDIFQYQVYNPEQGEDVHACTGDNEILSLESIPGLIETPENNDYSNNICFGNLECESTQSLCSELGAEYKTALYLKAETASRAMRPDIRFYIAQGSDPYAEYPWKICCKPADSVSIPQCSDGIDNDGDELIDYPEDPGCSSLDDNSEEDIINPDPIIEEIYWADSSLTPTQISQAIEGERVYLYISGQNLNEKELKLTIKKDTSTIGSTTKTFSSNTLTDSWSAGADIYPSTGAISYIPAQGYYFTAEISSDSISEQSNDLEVLEQFLIRDDCDDFSCGTNCDFCPGSDEGCYCMSSSCYSLPIPGEGCSYYTSDSCCNQDTLSLAPSNGVCQWKYNSECVEVRTIDLGDGNQLICEKSYTKTQTANGKYKLEWNVIASWVGTEPSEIEKQEILEREDCIDGERIIGFASLRLAFFSNIEFIISLIIVFIIYILYDKLKKKPRRR